MREIAARRGGAGEARRGKARLLRYKTMMMLKAKWREIREGETDQSKEEGVGERQGRMD